MPTLDINSVCILNDRNRIPLLGLGVYASSTCTKACLTSFDEGYRHIDTAELYGNEAEVGVRPLKLFSLYRHKKVLMLRALGSRSLLLPSSLLYLPDFKSMGPSTYSTGNL